jgi:hypothetical protein
LHELGKMLRTLSCEDKENLRRKQALNANPASLSREVLCGHMIAYYAAGKILGQSCARSAAKVNEGTLRQKETSIC